MLTCFNVFPWFQGCKKPQINHIFFCLFINPTELNVLWSSGESRQTLLFPSSILKTLKCWVSFAGGQIPALWVSCALGSWVFCASSLSHQSKAWLKETLTKCWSEWGTLLHTHMRIQDAHGILLAPTALQFFGAHLHNMFSYLPWGMLPSAKSHKQPDICCLIYTDSVS